MRFSGSLRSLIWRVYDLVRNCTIRDPGLMKMKVTVMKAANIY